MRIPASSGTERHSRHGGRAIARSAHRLHFSIHDPDTLAYRPRRLPLPCTLGRLMHNCNRGRGSKIGVARPNASLPGAPGRFMTDRAAL